MSQSLVDKICGPERHFKTDINGLSIILAVVSDGLIFFQFFDGNNNDSSVS